MNMGALLRSIFQHEIPPDPLPTQPLPDDSEIRWAKSKLQAIKRRAVDELQVDVDLEQRFKQ